MTNPIAWGEAASQVIWSWWMAKAAYETMSGVFVLAFIALIGFGLRWLFLLAAREGRKP